MVGSLLGAGRFTFVDALRGIAAMAVVLFHAVEGGHIPALMAVMPAWLTAMISHGHLGVAVFFVLSGFVIAHATYGQTITPSYLGRFMLRRSIRLDPPYWFAIAVAVGFAVLSAWVLHKPAPDMTWPQVVAHVFYLQGMLGYPQLNTVFWTLCLEIQFYLVYVALLAIAGNMAATTLVAACVVSVLWPLFVAPDVPLPGTFLPFWHGFLVGALAYWAIRQTRLVAAFWLFAATIATIAIATGNAFSLTCAVTVVVLSVAATTGSLYTGLNWRWLQFLGLISYSLYLLHNPVTGASFRVGYMLTGHSVALELMWWAVSIGACVAAAGAAWWCIERPSIKLARKIRLSTANVAESAAAPAISRKPAVTVEP